MTTSATSPDRVVDQAGFTKMSGHMPGFVNASRLADGRVRLSIRPDPDPAKAGAGYYPPAVEIMLDEGEWKTWMEVAKAI